MGVRAGRAGRWLIAALAGAAALAALAGCTFFSSASDRSKGAEPAATPASDLPRLCGKSRPGSHTYRHVVVVVFENKAAGQIVGSPDAPTFNSLSRACGLATDYYAVAHPSLPNYLALTSGSTWGVGDDDPPSAHPLAGPSIFSQLGAAGATWREYMESAPGPCPSTSEGRYAVKHDPAPYYTDLASACRRFDLPLGSLESGPFAQALAGSRLPSFVLVVPDLCNDMHDCPIATGDAWLRSFLGALGRSPAYRHGDTALFVTWDEAEGDGPNQVPLLVAAPTVQPGTRVAKRLTHYSALATWEKLLGLPCLGEACGAPSMRAAFGL